MRRALAGLALVLSACAIGEGVDPDVDTTAPATTAPPATIVVDQSSRDAAVEVASRFYDAVLARDGTAAAALGTDPPATIQDQIDGWAGPIGLEGGSFIVLRSTFTDTTAEVTVRLSLDLVEVGPWSYETTVTLVGGPDWTTLWDPSALHPSLEPGDLIRVDRAWPPRASILAADGTPLAGAEPVKVVGVVPAWIEDRAFLTAELARLAGIAPSAVDRELDNPIVQPDWFLPVGMLKTVVYEAIRAELDPIPGVLIRDGSQRLPYRDDFATHLIGTTGSITAEQLERLGFPYGPTDVVGQSGLEARYEDRLAGRPRTSILRVNRFGRLLEELFVLEAAEPEDLRTTLDVDVQAAVEQSLRDVVEPAAVVVLQASTGEVRGVVSRPASDGFDRAILGQYPPGSTFKIVTAAGLLGAGLTPDTEVECPAEVTVGGLVISNAGDADRGTITLEEAFAASCNTTFAELTVSRLGSGALGAAAASFGFGGEPDLGIPAAGGSFPNPVDTAETAAAGFGQGRVAVSPVHMASVAAAAATGTWRPPTVIAKPTRAAGIELDPTTIALLQGMMRAVVTDGTGTNAAVPGVAVHGKTGSAEYPGPRTHAWFVGFWDDYAIAVVVEGGGGGGGVAAPIARRVIAALSG